MKFFRLLLLLITSTAFAQKLVMPGDYPDPSVVKIGDTYWASATTSNWAPVFPILKSKDLISWETTSHVFTELPGWADYYFWAPEISYEDGKTYIYYTAHKKDGNLCVATAVADKPEGPYKDLGPLICQEVGSIDAFPMRDENGKLHIIWKEDGNSVNMPTPIWISELSEDRTKLIGDKKELFRNDKEWEANLVEGVAMLRHGKYIYAFYAGAGCCGRGCTYNIGVARAEKLLGPWEKYEKNPLLITDKKWKCPGHGTPVEKDGKFFLLHHAYDSGSGVFTGREGLLTEFEFTDDDWIRFIPEETSATGPTKNVIVDNFNTNTLSPNWQWSVFDPLDYKIEEQKLFLESSPDKSGSFIARKTTSPNYSATVKIFPGTGNTASGLGLIGDEKNFVRLMVKGKTIEVTGMEAGTMRIIEQLNVKHQPLMARIEVKNGKDITFYVGENEKNLEIVNKKPIDAFFLPPWDRAVRVALFAHGEPKSFSVFDDFTLQPK